MFQFTVLLALICGFSVWHYTRRGYVLQLGIFFNICALTYMAIGLAITRMTMPLSAPELELVGWMSVAAVFGFNCAYLIAGARLSRVSRQASNYLPSHTVLLFVVGVALSFEVAAILLIGPLEFLVSDRLERLTDVRPRIVLFYFVNLVNVCLPMAMVRYFRLGLRRDRILMYFLLAHGVTMGLITISRFDISIALLCLCYFLERNSIIRPHQVFVVLIVSLAMTLFYKPSLYQALLGQSYYTEIDFGEYTNWIRHTVILLGRPDVELPHNGYLLALRSLFVPRPEEAALSEWFIREFFYERTLLFPGVGYGFSGVWEGYAVNGLPGVALQFAFFGAFFGWLERSPSAIRQVFIVFALILMYRLFRSETYNFVKTYAWYFAYPTFAIVLVDKFMTFASRRQTIQANQWPRKANPGELRGLARNWSTGPGGVN